MLSTGKYFSLFLFVFSPFIFADDTELFFFDTSSENNLRPQVLIIFDNSGSMRVKEPVVIKKFSPTKQYTKEKKTYWSNSGDAGLNSYQYLDVTKNNCKASYSPLKNKGKYEGKIRYAHYSAHVAFFWGWAYDWKYLYWDENDSIYDCEEDQLSQNIKEYPINNKASPYSKTKQNVFKGNDNVTLYTANYYAWYTSTSGVNSTKSRLAMAKEVISTLIKSTPSVDFGLAIFNKYTNGGRIVSQIKERKKPENEKLVNVIDSLVAETYTPLTETMYEIYRYYAGIDVYYHTGSRERPLQDINIVKNKTYISPFKTCQQKAYIVLMTDGEPTYYPILAEEIKALTNTDSPIARSYMPVLAQWMHHHDINPNLDGDQNITTYTIGFGSVTTNTEATDLLTKTAELGGGEYFAASDSDALQKAFQKAIISILNETGSLSSPAIGSGSFDSTRSLNTLYYSSFLPTNNSLWRGNIKKLQINKQGQIIDRLGNLAINEAGNIKNDTSTFWGGNKDGNNVTKGGVVAMFENMQADKRKILSNIGTDDELLTPSISTLSGYYKVSNIKKLSKKLGLKKADNVAVNLKWLLGYTQNTNDSTLRSDIFADPLHSKPLVIPYIENGKQVVRLLMGNNSGFVHLFTDKGDSLIENWAFIPAKLLPYAMQLKNKKGNNQHNYGMDLSAMLVKTYKNKKVDKMIAIIGMRRGGNSYYALDITNADTPKLLWKINPKTKGFSELGQTWSVPISGEIYYKKNPSSKPKAIPVIFFGGGYDTQKDTCTRNILNTCSDSQGRAVYIVNALTGEKIKSFEAGNCTEDVSKNKYCMAHSFASQLSILDSDQDGYIDRIYAADTGGNIWRLDLKGNIPSKWTSFKFAQLSGNYRTNDRRFFNPPVIVRSYKMILGKEVAYDGLLIGSGDRTSPATKKSTKNRFYFLQDFNVHPTLFNNMHLAPAPILNKNLFSLDLIGKTENFVYRRGIETSPGWMYKFELKGEKALGRATLLNGNVYFTSYVPNDLSGLQCGVNDIGFGWLYSININSGKTHLKKKNIGARIPDDLVTYSGVNDKGKKVIYLLGIGSGTNGSGDEDDSYSGSLQGSSYKMYKKTYSYFTEP